MSPYLNCLWKQQTNLFLFSSCSETKASGNGVLRHNKVTNAIIVARCLEDILVLPDVIKKRSGDWRKFGVYDVHKFVTSLEGVVKISITQHAQVSNKKLTLTIVPNGVSEDYVDSKVEPLYKRKEL